MFQALKAHHQEANCIDAASGIVLSVSGHSVHRLRENCKALLCSSLSVTTNICLSYNQHIVGCNLELHLRCTDK